MFGEGNGDLASFLVIGYALFLLVYFTYLWVKTEK